MTRPFHDQNEIFRALTANGNNHRLAAAALGIPAAAVRYYQHREGAPVTLPSIANGVRWDAANVARLHDMIVQKPRPSLSAVAESFGITISALHTAMSRHGLTHNAGTDVDSRFRRRPCITCESPFISEGIHNRMCHACRAHASEIAA